MAVTVESPYSGELHYEPGLTVSAPDTPQAGDRVRLLAHFDAEDRYGEPKRYKLMPLLMQLQKPSRQRFEQNDAWARSIARQIEELDQGDPQEVKNRLATILEDATYREEGHRFKTRLTRDEMHQMAAKVEAVCEATDQDPPFVLSLLKKSPGDLMEVLYAAREGWPVFSMSKAELQAAVQQEIATTLEYESGKSKTYTFRLMKDVMTPEECVAVACRTWEAYKDEPMSGETFLWRLRNIEDIVRHVTTPDRARLFSEMMHHEALEMDKYGAESAVRDVISMLRYHGPETPGPQEFEVLGIYHDLLAHLRSRVKVTDPEEPQRLSKDLEETFNGLAAHYYGIARQQGLLP